MAAPVRENNTWLFAGLGGAANEAGQRLVVRVQIGVARAGDVRIAVGRRAGNVPRSMHELIEQVCHAAHLLGHHDDRDEQDAGQDPSHRQGGPRDMGPEVDGFVEKDADAENRRRKGAKQVREVGPGQGHAKARSPESEHAEEDRAANGPATSEGPDQQEANGDDIGRDGHDEVKQGLAVFFSVEQ